MLAKLDTFALVGIDAVPVVAEVDASAGLPKTILVGLAEAAVRESIHRIERSLVNLGYRRHPGRTVINLAPAELKKDAGAFDLPIAVALLIATGQLSGDRVGGYAIAGELALDGSVRPVRGALAMAMSAAGRGIRRVIVPSASAREAAVVKDVEVIGVASLAEAVGVLSGQLDIPPAQADVEQVFARLNHYDIDFADVRGQEFAKRALVVAASGGHNVLMIGSPGTGKSMLAARLPTILPPLIEAESLETTRVYSATGRLPVDEPLLTRRPFRTPHHTIRMVLIYLVSFPRMGGIAPEPPTRATPVTTISYAYKRFSSGKQKKGDSEARQVCTAEQAADRKGWLLDDTLDLTDRGVSAFRSANSLIGKLGKFIKHVDEGTVKPGSVLMVENLDRLSRDQIDNALTLTRDILRRGVQIYEIQDDVLYTRADLNEPMKLMLLIVKYARAHDESATKSRRSARNWSKIRANLGNKKMTKMVPYWLELRPDRSSFAVIEERAEMVRDIFRWCVDGVGIATIAARLNAAGRKTGHQCKQVGSSSVQKILRNRAVIGEFTPMSGRGKERKPSGDTVKDYYPRIVDEGLWMQAQLALNGRGFAQGRKSKKVNNLFERIAYNARDGYKLTFRDALPPRRPTSRLLSIGAIAGWPGSDYGSFTYNVVEASILCHLSELDVASIFPDRSSSDRLKLSAMKEELEQIDADLKQLNEEMAQPGMAATLLPAVRRLVARKNKVAEDYQVLNAKCVSPDADQLHTVQELLRETGGFNPTDETTRLRLRSAIQRIISGIWLLGVSRGQDRLYAVQIDFKGGTRRSYIIQHRPPKSNGKATVAGYWQVLSWKLTKSCPAPCPEHTWVEVVDGVQDNGVEYWKGTEMYLTEMSAEDLDLMFHGCERNPLP